MTGKRYFKRMWEEEFYIFDSETISENEFDEKVEYEDYQAFADSMLGDEVVNKLNQLNDENERLKACVEEVVDFFSEENEQLKKRNKKRLQRLKNQRKELKKQQEVIWGYKGDIKQLKTQLKDCEKRTTDKEVEWLRNNTVWEQMPLNKRTYISTAYHRRNDE